VRLSDCTCLTEAIFIKVINISK